MPETLQITALLEEFDTVAAKVIVFPGSTAPLDGVTLTAIAAAPGDDGVGAGLVLVVAAAHPAKIMQSVGIPQTAGLLLAGWTQCWNPDSTACV